MRPVENIFNSVVKAVGAYVNNDNIFKKRKRTAFDPKQLSLGLNFIQGNVNPFPFK